MLPSLTNNTINVNGFELYARTPYLQSWNLTVEREIGHESAIEVGYVGSKGTHLGNAARTAKNVAAATAKAIAESAPTTTHAAGVRRASGFVLVG